MPHTPNGGSVGGVGSVSNPGMSPFGQPMTSPAPQYPLQSNGPAALPSPGHVSGDKARPAGGPVASPFMNHGAFRGEAGAASPAAGGAATTPATPLAHASPAPEPRAAPAPVSAQMAALQAAPADDSPEPKREPDDVRVKEEPEDPDCGGKVYILILFNLLIILLL